MSFHTRSKTSHNLIKFSNINVKEYSAPILDANTLNIMSEIDIVQMLVEKLMVIVVLEIEVVMDEEVD